LGTDGIAGKAKRTVNELETRKGKCWSKPPDPFRPLGSPLVDICYYNDMFVYEEEVEVDEVKLSEVPVPTEFANARDRMPLRVRIRIKTD